jgi:hypothetical protein
MIRDGDLFSLDRLTALSNSIRCGKLPEVKHPTNFDEDR